MLQCGHFWPPALGGVDEQTVEASETASDNAVDVEVIEGDLDNRKGSCEGVGDVSRLPK